jgi:hypothetical protein
MDNSKRIAIVTFVAALSVISGCRELANKPTAAVYIQPSVAPNPSMPWYFPLTTAAGDNTVTPTWLVSQWNIPVDLTGVQNAAPGTDWSVANLYARVKYIASSKTYELAQNGQSPGSRPCNVETDLFLSPLGQNYPTFPQGQQSSKSLDLLANLGFRAGLLVTYENIQNRCTPSGAYDFVSYAASFIFSSSTGQTLFYQVQLRQNGLGTTLPNMSWCPNNNDPATAHLYCIDDDIHYLNSSFSHAAVGQHVTYTADMLPRVKQVVQSGYRRGDGSNEMIDGNLAHWKLTGIYIGSYLQGGANVTSQWDSFCLIEQEPGGSTTNTVCQ